MSKKKRLAAIVLSACMLGSVGFIAACGDDDGLGSEDATTHTYRTYTAVSPSNWNELTYQDQNDTQIMSYISGAFFEYDFLYDSQGNIVEGDYEVEYSAATNLEDVTADYADEWGLTAQQVEAGGYAWAITLRDDLKWDDGTEIHADDFVYSMSEQLNPDFLNYRADSYYNSGTVIHNARNYVYQGQSGWFAADTAYDTYSTDLDSSLIFTLGSSDDNSAYGGATASIRDALGASTTTSLSAVVAALAANGCSATLEEVQQLQGKTFAAIKADSTLNAIWEKIIGWRQTLPNEELDFFVVNYTFPEMDFSEVGLFVGDNENELVIVLDSPLALKEEDDSLSYLAAYQLSSLPLVKKDLYEANKHEPVTGSTVWTSTYNSSVASTASWGPYKLTQFQAGTSYTLERNNNWYGYNMDKYDGQYQTDIIYCRTVAEWNTAWQMFQNGLLDSISMDVTIANDYRNASRTLFTPSDFVSSLQLQSNSEALKNRETSGVDKEMLTYTNFRKALSLAIDRADYAATTTTASQAGFGLFNSMHYYDVANGGVYRDTDEAKAVLLRVYGYELNEDGKWTDGTTVYDDIDEASDSITGYNLTLARELLTEAYEAALAEGTISETDNVVLTYGTAVDNENTRRYYNYLNESFQTLAEGTPLEGRLSLEFNASFGDEWAESFRNGEYDICEGGWSGAAWDPGYFLLAYLSPDYMYSTAWDTSAEEMTFTMPTVEEWTDEQNEAMGLGKELTMSLMDWYNCLNGLSDTYVWASGYVPDSVRLALIAALEEVILEHYYTVPTVNQYTAELYSFKTEYITTTYNTFMSYGGIRYLTYNYTDGEWAAYVRGEGGTLDYRA